MKLYAVQILPAAEQAILEQAQFIAADKPMAAFNWLKRLWGAIDDLAHSPKRNPVSPAESDAIGVEIRKLVFGNYLIFYRVHEDQNTVEVLRFRHAARLPEDS